MASPLPPHDDRAEDVPLPTSPTPSWARTCEGCDKAFSLPHKHLLALQFTNHEKVCPVLTNRTLKPDDKDKFMFAKLVHEHELNKMEVKTKCGEMPPV